MKPMPTRRIIRVLVVAGLAGAMLVPTSAGAGVAIGGVTGGATPTVTPPADVLADDVALAPEDAVKAGVAVVDGSWHVGASAGQYATNGTSVGSHGVDPHAHSTRRESSYGLESRLGVRALVIEGLDGERIAVVSNDMYIPQDLVNRRMGVLLEERDQRIALGLEEGHLTGITEANAVVSVSHSHTSPYYSTPSWGVWAFEDVFDVRFFEYLAQRMATAVVEASADLVPVRMGAATVPFDSIQRHSFGPQVADDGTPAGYPQTDNDKTVTVLRFDDISEPDAPAPLANWVVFGLHPEMLDGNDLVSGEYVQAMYRYVDREVGGTTLFSQNNTGSAEPARNGDAHPTTQRAEYTHGQYAQMERAARLLADAVEHAHALVGAGAPANPATEQVEPFSSDFEVMIKDLRFAPPGARALPTVSSCRAERYFSANPGVPVAGLPDCVYPMREVGITPPFDPRVTYDTLRQAGVPVPDNVGAPSYTGLQETVQVHLQAIRLGDIGVTVCPCEQWADQSRNIKSRLDKVPGNLWLGWDWSKQTTPSGRAWCVQNAGADITWTCGNPRTKGATDLPPVTDHAYQRMVAQVNNNACRGPGNTDCWDEPANALQAETDPWDPDDIWGNFIHEELTPHGYDLVVTVGMSNDYWGYIASYREYQRGDHYRKALTGLGPHSMDFLATRLSRMAAELNGGPEVVLGAKDLAYAPEDAHERNRARVIGEIANQYVPMYEKTLPADGGTPAITAQPASLERFGAAKVSWTGGSNWFDLPDVKVQRFDAAAGHWRDYGDMRGEVQALVHYPQTDADIALWRAGQFEWRWDATFEAFASDIDLVDAVGLDADATPVGTYRFVVWGVQHEGGGQTLEYSFPSDSFSVGAWSGIQVQNLVASDGIVEFDVVGQLPAADGLEGGYIDYPDSYASPFRFINNKRETLRGDEVFCLECTFRPWADAGTVRSAPVYANGSRIGSATCDANGHCVVPVSAPGAEIEVRVTDRFGNYNGVPALTTGA